MGLHDGDGDGVRVHDPVSDAVPDGDDDDDGGRVPDDVAVGDAVPLGVRVPVGDADGSTHSDPGLAGLPEQSTVTLNV